MDENPYKAPVDCAPDEQEIPADAATRLEMNVGIATICVVLFAAIWTVARLVAGGH